MQMIGKIDLTSMYIINCEFELNLDFAYKRNIGLSVRHLPYMNEFVSGIP